MATKYENNYNLQENDNIIELIPRIKLDIIKEIYEALGINLGKSNNKIEYRNYLVNDPEAFGQSFGNDNGENIGSIDFSGYNGEIISIDKFMKIFPNANKDYATAAIYALDKYGDKVGLDNKGKLMVLAQFVHESGYFKYSYELGRGNGKSYGNPSGPYKKIYYGRGPIQITWEQNYKTITQEIFPAMGINANIWENPDLCEQNYLVGCAASLAWFMLQGNGKMTVKAANAGDIKNLTKAINGGYNGIEDRIKITQKIIKAISNA